MNANDDKMIQSIDSIKTYAYGMSKVLVCKKEEIRCNNIIKQKKMINYDYITKESTEKHSPK